MLNLIGSCPARELVLAAPGAHLHLYQKEALPDRKLGHITIVEAKLSDSLEKAAKIEAMIRGC